MIDASVDLAPVFNPSFQISRYSYRPLKDGEEPRETVDYVEQICPPDVSPPNEACYPSLNYSGFPHTGGGTSPFIHDYLANDPVVKYVKDADSGAWRLANRKEDVPYGGAFVTAFPDNRNVVRPFENLGGGPLPAGVEDWQAYPIYTEAGWELDASGVPIFGSCLNPGSRDQNVLTAEISLGLRVTAPTNYKPFESPVIEFPMTVWNNTNQERQFELTIPDNPLASFAKDYVLPLQVGAVTIFPYSSSSLNVYAFDGNPVTVKVEECNLADCDHGEAPLKPLTGSITFNAPAAAPPPCDEGEPDCPPPPPAYTSSTIAVNPVPKNPVPKNPVPKNPVPKNPVPKNALPEDEVFDVIDYSWTVTTTSQDDAGTYLALPNIDKAFQDDYIFQIFVTKPSMLRQVSGKCDPSNLPLGTLIGHISEASNPVPKNPVPKNPVPKNPVPKNATLSDTLVQNTTFTLASDTTATSSGNGFASVNFLDTEGCDPETGGGRFGKCTLFAPRMPNQVTFTVRAYQITGNPSPVWNPHGPVNGIPNVPATVPSVTVADYWCTGEDPADDCAFAQDGPELMVPSESEIVGVDPTTVQAGQTVTFPLSTVNVTNVGSQPAQEHRIGYYISAAVSVSDLPRNNGTIPDTIPGTIDTSGPDTELLLTVDAASLEPVDPEVPEAGPFETVGSKDLTIPVDIPRPNSDGTGTYYLYAYVDDERVVSEINEDDNFIQGGPITVQAPGLSGILGLFTPCDGLTCERKAGPALPFAFQLTFDGVTPVDSESTPPRLLIFAPDLEGECDDPTVDGELFRAEPDDVASGSSGWQYFDASCAPEGPNVCSRDAFTHQYNWQTKYPGSSDDLLPGCYTVVIEVPDQNQVLGSLLGPVEFVELTLN